MEEQRLIFHIDVNSAFLSWTAVKRLQEDPSSVDLRTIPSAVGGGTRIELRSPDCAANPYLTIALCLAAGLDGMKNKITPPENIQKNIFSMSEEEKAERNIKNIPSFTLQPKYLDNFIYFTGYIILNQL